MFTVEKSESSESKSHSLGSALVKLTNDHTYLCGDASVQQGGGSILHEEQYADMTVGVFQVLGKKVGT